MGEHENLDVHGSSAIVLPAGYGKTEYIANYADEQNRPILILTHTNAGVFALKRRLAGREHTRQCRVTTIAAWCESWVISYPSVTKYKSFSDEKEMRSNAYFKKLYEAMLILCGEPWFRKALRASYYTVIVDEYQDCTMTQHALFLGIAEFLQLLVLGDPLQGIFYWIKDDSLVDWSNLSIPIQDVESKPWRWINSGCAALGDYIGSIRKDLMPTLGGQRVQIALDRGCSNVQIVTPEFIGRNQRWNGLGEVAYITCIQNVQYSFSQRHPGFQSNEAVDNKEAFSVCSDFDNRKGADLALAALDFAALCFTGVSQGLKPYRSNLEKGKFDFSRIRKHPDVKRSLMALGFDSAIENVASVLTSIKDDSDFRLHRGILYHEVRRALKLAIAEDISASEALENIRAQRSAFEEHNPCQRLSTRTVLSKGLEFDTAIVDAGSITDPRDFYVAISRCKKRLIIVSNSSTLTFPGITHK